MLDDVTEFFKFSSDLGWEPLSQRNLDHPSLILLGDSVAAGHGLEEKFRLDVQLKAKYQIEALNLAVPGYGTDQAYLRLVKQDLDLAGKHVSLIFCLRNDPLDNNSRYFIYDTRLKKPYYVFEGSELKLVNHHLQSHNLLARGAFLFHHLYLFHWSSYILVKMTGQPIRNKSHVAPNDQVTRALIAKINEYVTARNGKFSVILVPDKKYYSGAKDITELIDERYRRKFYNFGDGLSEKNSDYYLDAIHLSSLGTEKLADLISRNVMDDAHNH